MSTYALLFTLLIFRRCIICLIEYRPGAEIRFLPCMHVFHRLID